MRHLRLGLLLLLLLGACQPREEIHTGGGTGTSRITAPVDAWVLRCVDKNITLPSLLWNGLIGVRVGRDSTSGDAPMFMIDEYETSGEEKIRGIPSPLQAAAYVGNVRLSPDKAIQYRQDLDMRTGVLTTEWTQPNPAGRGDVSVTCETVMHPLSRLVAQRWHLAGADLSLRTAPARIEGVTAGSTDLGVSSFQGLGISKVKWSEKLVTKSPTDAEVTWSFGRSPESRKIMWPSPTDSAAGWDAPKVPIPFDDILKASKTVWAKRWQTDIEIDGPVADQQAVRSFLFYLRSAIHPDGGMSISPFGLSNQQYNGHVFWDADIWVFPALAFVDPNEAREIPGYRIKHYYSAKENFLRGLSWPEAGKAMYAFHSPVDQNPIQFPWESSVTGLEVSPPPSRKEIHVSGSVLWGFNQALALGMLDDPLLFTRAGHQSPGYVISHFYWGPRVLWSLRSTPRILAWDEPLADSPYELREVMSPDENHIGDNDLYTNLLAQWDYDAWTIQSNSHEEGLGPVFRWMTPAERKKENVPTFKLPRDGTSFLTYDGDPVKSYKQAAAVLAIYPLQYPPAEKEARVMMDRFADKVIKNGPAMTESVHSIIWSRLGEKEKAYATWLRSWQEFVKQPHLLFSEKRNKDVTYFTTGAGGSLQSVIYGFLGFRLDSKKEPGAAWSKKLNGESWLSIKPNLPPAWKSVKFKNFTVLDQHYTLRADSHGATVIQGD